MILLMKSLKNLRIPKHNRQKEVVTLSNIINTLLAKEENYNIFKHMDNSIFLAQKQIFFEVDHKIQ